MGYMEIKIKPELAAELAGRIERFTFENFYTAKEKTPEGQTELRENFFSRPKAPIKNGGRFYFFSLLLILNMQPSLFYPVLE
jgi:hypothetical protein